MPIMDASTGPKRKKYNKSKYLIYIIIYAGHKFAIKSQNPLNRPLTLGWYVI